MWATVPEDRVAVEWLSPWLGSEAEFEVGGDMDMCLT